MHVREFRVRYRKRQVPKAITTDVLKTGRDAARVFTQILGADIVEVCGVLCLSTKSAIIAYHELSRGTLDATIVHPRDIFRVALLTNAASVIVGHNHPSGVVQPSPDDLNLTKRLTAAGEVIGIPLADHVIVNTSGDFFSFHDAALL